MSTAIQDIRERKSLSPVPTGSLFSSVQSFETGQRMAKALMSSSLFPKNYNNLGDAMIVLEMSQRVGMSPLMVAQNLDVIYGRPAWRSQFAIAAVNQSGRFAEPLEFEFEGTKGQDDWGCRAVTTSHKGRRIEGPLITIGLAKLEGWYDKKDSKWQTIPELMLRYRAGSWFARTECPEILLGFQSVDEVHDYIDVDPETGDVIDVGGPVHIDDKRPPAKSDQQAKDEPESAGSDSDDGDVDDGEEFPKKLPDGTYIDANGQVWNEELHALSAEGLPVVNKDGSFRARRGTASTANDDGNSPDSSHPNAPGGDNKPPPSDDDGGFVL